MPGRKGKNAPYNTDMSTVMPDEILYIDYKLGESNRLEPCDVKFKTYRFDDWLCNIESRYKATPVGMDPNHTMFNLPSVSVVINCYRSSGVIIIQGSGFWAWAHGEFQTLSGMSPQQHSQNVDNFIASNKWEVKKSPNDGHCLIHSIVFSNNCANPEHTVSYEEACHKIREEVRDHPERYLPFLVDCSADLLISEVDDYLTTRLYNRRCVDIIPYILSNALCVGIEMVHSNHDGHYYIIVVLPLHESQLNSIMILKSGSPDPNLPAEHFDSLIPLPLSPEKLRRSSRFSKCSTPDPPERDSNVPSKRGKKAAKKKANRGKSSSLSGLPDDVPDPGPGPSPTSPLDTNVILTNTLEELDTVKQDNLALSHGCELLMQDLSDKDTIADGLRNQILAMTTQIRDLQAENRKLRSSKSQVIPPVHVDSSDHAPCSHNSKPLYSSVAREGLPIPTVVSNRGHPVASEPSPISYPPDSSHVVDACPVDTYVLGTSLVDELGPCLNKYGTNATVFRYSGADIPRLRSRVPHILPSTGRIKVVVQGGGNDADSSKPTSTICNDFSDLIDEIKKRNDDADVTVVGIPPRRLKSQSATDEFMKKSGKVNHYLSTMAFMKPNDLTGFSFINACPTAPHHFQGGWVKIHFNETGRDIYARNLHAHLSGQ